VDLASDGKTGASVYGDENDNCSNIRQYLEAKGFTYLGEIVDNPTDKSADMMFAQPKYVEAMRSCIQDRQWKTKSWPTGSPETCMHTEITKLVHKEVVA